MIKAAGVASADTLSPGKDFEEVPVAEAKEAPKPQQEDNLLPGKDFEEVPVTETEYLPANVAGTVAEEDKATVSPLLFSKGAEGFDTSVRADQGKLEWALQNSMGVSADVAAKVQRLATEKRVPFEEIQGNKDAWFQWDEAQKIHAKLVGKNEKNEYEYPFTAQWIQDPTRMALSKDDLEGLTQIEKWLKEEKNQGFFKQAGKTAVSGTFEALSGAAKMPAGAFSTAQLIQYAQPGGLARAAVIGGLKAANKYLDAGLPDLNFVQETPKVLYDNKVTRALDEKAADWLPPQAEGDILEQVKAGNMKDAARTLTLQAIQNAPNTLMIMGSYLSGVPAAGLGAMFLSQAGQVTQQDAAEGKSPLATAIDAAAQGGIESWSETIGTYAIMKRVGASIEKSLGKAASRDFFKQVFWSMGDAFVAEGNEEVVASLGEDFADYMTGDKDAMQGAFGRAVNAFMIGGVSGAGMVAPGAIANGINNSNKLNKEMRVFREQSKAVENAKTGQRSPEAMAQYLEGASDQLGLNKHFLMSAEPIAEFFQKDPEAGDKFLESLGIQKEDFKEALVSGKEIEIAKATWLSKFAGTDVAKALEKFIRFDTNGMTEHEQKTLGDDVKVAIKDLSGDIAKLEEDRKIPTQILEMRETMLKSKEEGGAGYKAEDADAQLGVQLAILRTLAKETRETPQELFDRIQPTLRVTQEEGVQTPGALEQGKLIGSAPTAEKMIEGISKYFYSKNISLVAREDGSFDVHNANGKIDGVSVVVKKGRYRFEMDAPKVLNQAQSGRGSSEKVERPPLKKVGPKEILALRDKGDKAPFITPYSEEEMQNWEHYLSSEGVGFSLTAEKDMVGVFNNSGKPGGGEAAVIKAIEEGAKTCDCISGYLDKYYNKFGFVEIKKVMWDDQYAPKGWNYEKYGRPEIKYLEFPESLGRSEEDTRQRIELVRLAQLERLAGRGQGRDNLGFYFVNGVFDWRAWGRLDKSEQSALIRGIKNNGGQLEQGPRGSIQFSDSGALITLYKDANMSTFLHETAHLFTSEMQRIIEAGQGSEQFKKDFQTLLKFADGKLDTAGHEKIARAFEAYLREGKAPSLSLVDSFRRFKSWLVAIYKSLSELGVKPSDEVKQVFDRLLASEKDIAEVQEYYKEKSSLADVLNATDEEKAKIEAKRKEAKATAEERQVKKYLRAFIEASGGRKAMAEGIAADMDTRPIYKALREARELGGLNRASVLETYGPQVVAAIDERHPGLLNDSKKTAVVGKLAAEHGFESPTDLITKMTETLNKEAALKESVDKVVAMHEAQIREDLQKQETAPGEESYHSEARLEVLIAEAKLLHDRMSDANKRPRQTDQIFGMQMRAYKDAAEENLAKKPIKNATRYDLYAKAEQRYAVKAHKAAMAGKFSEAYDAIVRQILNHVMVQASIKAREFKNEVEKRYAPKKFASALKNVEYDYAALAGEIAFKFGFTQVEPIGKPASALKDMDSVLASLIPSWIVEGKMLDGAESWKDLSLANVREIDEAITQIAHYGHDALSSLKDEGLKTVQEFVSVSVDKMAELPDKKVHDEFSWWGKQLSKFEDLISQTRIVQFVFDHLDAYSFVGKKVFGPLGKLFNSSMRAEAAFNDMKVSMLKILMPLFKVLNKGQQRIEAFYGAKSFQIPGVPVTDSMKQEGRNGWTAERMLAIVLNMGNAGNIQALMNGYGLTPEQLQIVASHFNEEELQAIQSVWDSLEGMYPKIDEVHFRLYNRHLTQVEAQPLTVELKDTATGIATKTVTLKGGYYPLVFDHALNDYAEKFKEQKDMRMDAMTANKNKAILRKTKPEDGFVYSRKPGHSLPPNLSLGVLFGHIEDSARFISHAEFLRDVNRITLNKDWREGARKKVGKETYLSIRDWASYLAAPTRPQRGAGMRFVETQKSLTAFSVLTYNIPSAIKQKLSLFSSLVDLGIGPLVHGLTSTDWKTNLGFESGETWKMIEQKSHYLRTRNGNYERDVTDMLSSFNPAAKTIKIGSAEYTWSDVKSFGFFMMTMSDRAVVAMTWKGAYDKYLGENLRNQSMTPEQAETDAVEKADAAISWTQPSALPNDMGAFQRSEGLLRFFTMFMSGVAKVGNRYMHFYNAYKDGKMSSQDYFTHVFSEVFLMSWAEALIMSLWRDWDLPEWTQLITNPMENMVSWIPFIRDLGGAYRYNKGIGNVPALSGIQKAVDASKQVKKALADGDEETWNKAAWSVGKAVEFQTGVPASRVVKEIENQWKNFNNEKEAKGDK